MVETTTDNLAATLRRAAANKALDIGTAWSLLELAADEIETLKAEIAHMNMHLVAPSHDQL